MCSIGALQTIGNENTVNLDITQIFNDINLMQYNINASIPLSYAIMSPTSIYTLFYSLYGSCVIGGSFVVVTFLMIKTIFVLRQQRVHMSQKTYSLNKQIQNVLLIQVRKLIF